MLRVITGRVHPHLETAFVDHVRRLKADDPFGPVAVVVPSKTLVDRLRRLLVLEQGLSLLNVHLLTFHQLALRLAEEVRASSPALQVVDELFFEQLIRHIVTTRLPSLAPLQQVGCSSGTWSALWATVRDLRDAGVEPVSALRAIDEGWFDEEDRPWLRALWTLHGAVAEASQALHAGTAEDLAGSLSPVVSDSLFLAGLKEAVYYGFYDLTQAQLSFFEAVSRAVPTTLFFPLDPHPSFRFAQRFFDRFLQPLMPRSDQLRRVGDRETADGRPPVCVIRSVVGAEEEVASTCRMILDLVETNGYRFEDIGVVARTLEPYQPSLQAQFDRHRIPLVCSLGPPLIQEPLCKTLLQLASLPLQDYDRTTMLEVVTSPLFRRLELSEAESAQADLWKQLVSALEITRGIDDWARLGAACGPGGHVTGGGADGSAVSLDFTPEVIQGCWNVVSGIIKDMAALPVRASVTECLRAFHEILSCRLKPARPDESDPGSLATVWESIDRVCAALTQLEPLGDEFTWAEFVDLLTHAIERTAVQAEEADHPGVAVLDVMAARGVPFKVLFVLGLNDHVFPRHIREDPFLRDRHRRVLGETLGYKIDEKLAGYEEEAILLALAQHAARDRLVLSYQRADEEGRVLTASPSLMDLIRLCGLDECPTEVVPRRLSERVAQRPAMGALLPPDELVQWMIWSGQDAIGLLGAVGRKADAFAQGMDALRRIEEDRPVLSGWDGVTGPLEAHWSAMLKQGVAPTPLERYARCPFHYFTTDVLRLARNREALTLELDASVLGTVCHAALRRCYEQLIPMGWPLEPVTDDSIAWCVRMAVEQAAAEQAARSRAGHYLLWEMAKDMLIDLLAAAVESDQAAQAGDPYRPVAFEHEARGTVPSSVPDRAPLVIRGRVDRMDRRRDSDEIRIVDYKLKLGTAPASEDRNLVQAAVRGVRLQPALYACLNLPGPATPAQVQLMFLAPRWPTPIVRSTFSSAVWSSETGARIAETLHQLTQGIQSGRFFILPNGYCETCSTRAACRRDHTPTWWRAHRAPEAKSLKALRMQRVNDA